MSVSSHLNSSSTVRYHELVIHSRKYLIHGKRKKHMWNSKMKELWLEIQSKRYRKLHGAKNPSDARKKVFKELDKKLKVWKAERHDR